MKTFFVSSTFRDMDEERDAIQQITLPRLNAIARTYGESVSFCDLRWGVDTTSLESDEGSRKVLDVCLDEIDRCRPPMVVILGDRYGWLPPAELIGEAVSRRQLTLDNLRKSITALEIEYGALTEDSCSNTLFYFREFAGDIPAHCASEDAEHLALLQKLKERILHLAPGRVKTYRVSWESGHLQGVAEFAALLADDLTDLMLPQWKQYSTLTPREQELRTHREYLLQKASMFYARNLFAEELISRVKNGEMRLILRDTSGSGKSTFFSHLALRFEEEGFLVFPLFSGLTTGSGTAMDLLQKIVFFLEDTLGLSHPLENHEEDSERATARQWKMRLNDLSHMCDKAKELRILIMVDAIDQLLQDDMRDSLAFLPQELSGSLRIFVTCLDNFPLRDPAAFSFPPFEQSEKEDMIRAILNAHHREISPPVIDAMSRLPQSDNPLYTSLLIQRMLMMNRQDFDRIRQLGDGMDAIIAHQLELLESCPADLDALCVLLLEIAGERINPALIGQVSKFLAISRRGLRAEDLRKILGADFNTLDFTHFITYMSDSFILRNDGRYDFSHRSIRQGYLDTCQDPQSLHRKLVAHFLSLEEKDPVRLTELVYHMMQSNDQEGLITYIEQYKDTASHPILRPAAATLFETSLENASWLMCLLKDAHGLGAGCLFVRFFLEDFLDCENGSAQDDYLVRNMLEGLIPLLEHLHTQGANINQEYARAIRFLTERKCNLNSIHWSSAPLSYLLSLSLLQELADTEPSASLLMQKARTCSALCTAYDRISNRGKALHYINRAILLAQEAAGKEENRRTLLFLAGCYEEQASLFVWASANQTTGHKRALAGHQKSFDCIRRACELRPETDNRRALCRAWQNLGNTLTLIGGSENGANLKEALSCFEKARELARGLEEENHDSSSRRLLADCYENTADILGALNRKKYAAQIMEDYQAALELRKQILFDQRTVSARENTALLFFRMAEHLLSYSTQEKDIQKAVSLCQSSLYFYLNGAAPKNETEEMLLQKQPDLCKALVPVYYYLADGLRRCGRGEEASAAQENALKYHRLCTSEEQAYAYGEMLEILRKMDPSYQRMIPYPTMRGIRYFRSRSYQPHLTASSPLSAQGISPKTQAVMAFLTTSYWTSEQEEKEELLSIFNANEEKYQKQFEKLETEALMARASEAKSQNPKLAFQCYLHAARRGSVEAAFLLSDCFWNGTGTDIDYEKSFETLRGLAGQGSVKAASRLGLKLTVNHFYDQGLPWLLQAAGQKDGKACAWLSELYAKGTGVLPDEEKSAYWHARAEEYGGYKRSSFAERLREKAAQKRQQQESEVSDK